MNSEGLKLNLYVEVVNRLASVHGSALAGCSPALPGSFLSHETNIEKYLFGMVPN